MRALVAVASFFAGFSSLQAWSEGEWCDQNAAAIKRFSELGISLSAITGQAPKPSRSSFKGLLLDSTPGEAAATLFKEGFEIWVNTYVSPPNHVSSFEICRARGKEPIGWIEFDQNGRAQRLTLQAGYFFTNEITVREFADSVFRHYRVTPDEVEDDACFQDVTCFRGRTNRGEQFLILKIGGKIQLLVRPLKPGE